MTKREIRNTLILNFANEKENLNYNDILEIASKLNTSTSLVLRLLFGNGFLLKRQQ